MPPPPTAAEPPFAAAATNPSWWRYLWEAQSHTSILRLLLFNPNTKASAQCGDLKLNLLHQQSLLTVSFLESDAQIETSIEVPVPRVLIDHESPLHFRTFEDHIEVKLVLLLPVDHPLVSDFDSILNFEENKDELTSLSVDSDIKKLSCMKEVHFYCRNCSSKLTKGLSCFEEMPSTNWRESADNWFGNCCCSFGGVSEKLVSKYAKSYTCDPGVCLLNTASVLLSKNDLLGCEFRDVKARRNFEPDLNPTTDNCLSRVSQDEIHVFLENQKVFLDGYLGNGFMVRSSGLSKDIQWNKFLCPECSCFLGAYPCFEDNVPLDGGLRLFKCYISTCLPCDGSDDVFRLPFSPQNLEEQSAVRHLFCFFLFNSSLYLKILAGHSFAFCHIEKQKEVKRLGFMCNHNHSCAGNYPFALRTAHLSLNKRTYLFRHDISFQSRVDQNNSIYRIHTISVIPLILLLKAEKERMIDHMRLRTEVSKMVVFELSIVQPNYGSLSGAQVGRGDPDPPPAVNEQNQLKLIGSRRSNSPVNGIALEKKENNVLSSSHREEIEGQRPIGLHIEVKSL
ncbi:hypothetical protein BUALT_Bualt04G0005100 [Buddleja alternifolia]|uniref:Ubiquitin-conjugating enzyme E2C-binding protein n=1 Tax=Buddleja alternifolia TaxID=168488 RepID=A0AAV6XK16_9LAMI|nr:hypothetical protein BUALT_Bualt04G0005100 [Buddleja alternifolia]